MVLFQKEGEGGPLDSERVAALLRSCSKKEYKQILGPLGHLTDPCFFPLSSVSELQVSALKANPSTQGADQ